MQSVSVYKRESKYLINVIHGSSGGDPCIQAGPVFVVESHVAETELGEKALEALAQSRSDHPWPSDWKQVIAPLLKAAGAKTWSAFAKKASDVRVDKVGPTVTVQGSYLDQKGAFYPDPLACISLLNPSAQELGAAIRRLLDKNAAYGLAAQAEKTDGFPLLRE